MNLNTLITSLKAKGTTKVASKKGFVYKTPDNWVDLQNNYFPKGLRGDSFTIKIESFEHHEEIEELGIANINIEFLADSKNDLYGNKFNEMQWIVHDMCQINEAFLQRKNQYKECEFEYFADMVLVCFNISLAVDTRHIEWESYTPPSGGTAFREISNTTIT